MLRTLKGVAKGSDDGDGVIALVAHAQREVAQTTARRERCGLAMEDEPATPGLVAPHLDGAPVGPAPFGLQCLDGRFFRCEAYRQTFSDRRGSSTVRGFSRSEDAVDISVAEPVEGR